MAVPTSTLDQNIILRGGTLTAAVVDTKLGLVIAAGSITDNSGNISFGNENLLTTGTLSTGAISATSVNIGADADPGTANTAGVLKMWSGGDNAFFTSLATGTQTASANYTLPVARPTASGQALLSTNADPSVMSWGTDFGSNDLLTLGNVTGLQLISSVADGTAPLIVTSTTVVANLNADQLDGIEGSALVPYTGADKAVDLGAQNLTTTGVVTSGNIVVGPSLPKLVKIRCTDGDPTTGLIVFDSTSYAPTTFGLWMQDASFEGVTVDTNGNWTGWGDVYFNYSSDGDCWFNNGGGTARFRGDLVGKTITGTSFVIGANSLGSTEFGYLNNQNQGVKTNNSPRFVECSFGTIGPGGELLVCASGSITDSTGAITFGDEDLSTTGEMKAATGHFGDAATNYAAFAADGTLKFHGDATVWKDINLGSAQTQQPASSAPSVTTFLDNAGADTDIATLGFAAGDKVGGTFELQHDYKEGSGIYFHIHFQCDGAPSGTDNVAWEIDYTIVRDDATMAATANISTGDVAIATQYKQYSADWSVVAGTNLLIGDQISFKLTRVAAAGDAYAGECKLKTVGLHYEIDTVGSRTITTK